MLRLSLATLTTAQHDTCGMNISPDKFINFTMNNIKKFGLKNYAVLVIMMICSIVGVGFVSGAEIYRFFVKFGHYAYFGIIIFFMLIYFLALKVLKNSFSINNVFNGGVSQNQNYLKMSNLNNYKSKIAILQKFKLKSFLTNFNVFILASAMFSGLFVVLKNLFNHNYFIFGFLCLCGLFLLVLFGVSMLKIFDYFVVFLIGFIAVYFLIFSASNRMGGGFETVLNFKSGFCGLVQIETDFNLKNFCFSALFSCVYVFMNIIQIQPIINQFSKKEALQFKIKISLKTCKKLAFCFAVLLSLLLFIFVKFFLKNSYLANAEMPFFKFFKNQGGVVFVLFVFGLMLALVSSLATALIGVKEQIKQSVNSNFLATAMALIFVGIASLIGFSNFVFYAYPIIGVLNFIIFVFL